MKMFMHEIIDPKVKRALFVDSDAIFVTDPTCELLFIRLSSGPYWRVVWMALCYLRSILSVTSEFRDHNRHFLKTPRDSSITPYDLQPFLQMQCSLWKSLTHILVLWKEFDNWDSEMTMGLPSHDTAEPPGQDTWKGSSRICSCVMMLDLERMVSWTLSPPSQKPVMDRAPPT
jgi:hypothetical protein